MTRRIVLATVGSLGDLHPFIALGLALEARGFAVLLASAAEYRDKVGAAGLAFHAVRPSFADLERDLGMSRAAVTHRIVADNRFLFRRLVVPYLRESLTDMQAACDGAALVVASSLAYGARLAAELQGIPCIGVALQPMMFLSAYDPPLVPRGEWLMRLLRALGPGPTAPLLRLVKRSLRGMFAPLEALRAELALPALRHDPLFEDAFPPGGAIGLYSPLLGAVQPDHPPHTRICGFAAFDSGDGRAARLDAALEAFVAAGAPPLVFTLGSLIVNDPGSFYRESVAAARLLGLRAVLLVGDGGLEAVADLAGDDVCSVAYAPHSLLFPRAAVVIHHGGIGTLAQGLASGRPALIVPFFADQVDNADRALRLGVARVLRPAAYRAAAAARQLRALRDQPGFAAAAIAVRQRLAAESGATDAAAFIETRLAALYAATATGERIR
jgi:UDP:flavonoid glycosyltransferase YjiC (YdhE family)